MFTLTIQRTETVLLLVRDVSLKNNLWEIKKMFNVKSNESSSHTELIDGSRIIPLKLFPTRNHKSSISND